MNISLFTPIQSSLLHPHEKYPVLRHTSQFFNWGQNVYKIKPYTGNSKLEVDEIEGCKPTLAGMIVRIVSYMTIIIPLIMLIGALIYRAVNNFQISSYEDIFKNKDIGKYITSQLTIKDLLAMRQTSHLNKAMADLEADRAFKLKKNQSKRSWSQHCYKFDRFFRE